MGNPSLFLYYGAGNSTFIQKKKMKWHFIKFSTVAALSFKYFIYKENSHCRDTVENSKVDVHESNFHLNHVF